MQTPKIPPPIPIEEQLEYKLSERSREVSANTIRFMREMEMQAPEPKRAKLREFRERFEALQCVKDDLNAELIDNFRSGVRFDGIELAHERLNKVRSPEERERSEQRLSEYRTNKQEVELLTKIAKEAGDDCEKLIAAAKDYIATHPDNHRGYTFLAGSLLKASDTTGAIDAYREGVRLAGEHTAPRLIVRARLGDALAKAGEIDGAIEELESGIGEATLALQVSSASYYLGNALNQAGRREEAEEAWELAVQYSGSYAGQNALRKKIAKRRSSAIPPRPELGEGARG